MDYRPADGHGLPHNPFAAIVAPRPIGWISTRSAAGHDNLAPYSFFNAVAYEPMQVAFASTGIKDTLNNLRQTGVFCVNVVERAMLEVMNATSAALPPGADEFAHAGLAREECRQIACARVTGVPAALECRVLQEVALTGGKSWLVIGEVVGVHLRDDCLVEGRFDVARFGPVTRLGYLDYGVMGEIIELPRPPRPET